MTTSITWQNRDEARAMPEVFELRLAGGTEIGGLIVDEAGEPIAGAVVEFDRHSSGRTQGDDREDWPRVGARISGESVTADEQGRWRWKGAPAHLIGELRFVVRHPDHVSGYVPRPEDEALRDQTARITLKRGVRLSGRVTDVDGKPVEGATVTTQTTFYVVNDMGVTATTDAGGRYELPAVAAGLVPVTVYAKGHGPVLERIDVQPERATLDVRLPAAVTLRGRLVDPDGNGIGEAYVRLDDWRGAASLPVLVRTDDGGWFEIPDMPDEPMHFAINASGFGSKFREELRPGEEDVTITLIPERIARGRVTDAETGEAIPSFRVVPGHQLWQIRPVSFARYNHIPTFKDGEYETRLSPHERVVASHVRIEAPGYRPVISDPLPPGETVFDAALERAADVTGKVFNPDGTPAAGVQVVIAAPGEQVSIENGRMTFDRSRSTETGDDGAFSLDPEVGAFELIVLGEEGYAQVKTDADAGPHEITLTRWATVQGVYQPAGGSLNARWPFSPMPTKATSIGCRRIRSLSRRHSASASASASM